MVVTRLETLTDRAFLRRFISPPAGETTTDTRHLPSPAKGLIIAPIGRLSGEDMTLDSRPVSLDALSLDALSAVALSAVALAVPRRPAKTPAGPTANSGPPSPPGPPPRAIFRSRPRTKPWPPT